MLDTYAVGVLLLVGYMALGALLGLAAHHVKVPATVALVALGISAGVVANSWRWLPEFHGVKGVAAWLFQGFAWYGMAATALFGVPFIGTFLAVLVARRHRGDV
jgi:zinc transporter ZupT